MYFGPSFFLIVAIILLATAVFAFVQGWSPSAVLFLVFGTAGLIGWRKMKK